MDEQEYRRTKARLGEVVSRFRYHELQDAITQSYPGNTRDANARFARDLADLLDIIDND